MKTVNQSPGHSIAVTRGQVAARRAGGNLRVRDESGTDIVVSTLTFAGSPLTELDDDEAIITFPGAITEVGGVTPDSSPFDVTTGTAYRAFPGSAWLDNPTATEHGVGDRLLIVYRNGTDHLVAGKIVGKIGTVATLTPMTYTLGSEFDIEDVANDLRPQGDCLSVLDIGGGDFRAVAWVCEYNGTVNLLPHLLVCDDSSATMTSSSTWTRYNVTGAFSGHTQDVANGRVHKLANGTFMMAGQHYAGSVHTPCVLSSTDITDWSSPTMVDIVASGYNEVDFEEMPDGTLYAHLRETAQVNTYSSTSTDSGATWSAPTLLFAGGGYPAWRRLNSGVGLTVYRNMSADFHAAWRQTQTASSDTGWGAETILDTTGFDMEYATILQVTNAEVLIFYALQATAGSATEANIFSQVFTDSSIFGTGASALDDLTDVVIASPQEDDTLRYVGGQWVNDNRRWEAVTDGEDVFVWSGDDLVHEWKGY